MTTQLMWVLKWWQIEEVRPCMDFTRAFRFISSFFSFLPSLFFHKNSHHIHPWTIHIYEAYCGALALWELRDKNWAQMERTFKIFVFLLPIACFAVSVLGGKVPSVYIFGDSIFDAGNNHYNIFCAAQADFPPYGSSYFHHPTGRFTNGRTVADFLCKWFFIN